MGARAWVDCINDMLMTINSRLSMRSSLSSIKTSNDENQPHWHWKALRSNRLIGSLTSIDDRKEKRTQNTFYLWTNLTSLEGHEFFRLLALGRKLFSVEKIMQIKLEKKKIVTENFAWPKPKLFTVAGVRNIYEPFTTSPNASWSVVFIEEVLITVSSRTTNSWAERRLRAWLKALSRYDVLYKQFIRPQRWFIPTHIVRYHICDSSWP